MEFSHWKWMVVSLLFCFGMIGVTSKCPPDNMVDFISIPEGQYDKNFSSVGEEGKRPFGFDQSVWYYNMAESDNPCIHISGTSRRRVEIMVETEPPNRLCMRTQTSGDLCFNTRAYRCLPARSDDFYMEFFCDDQCSESDVLFWYRLVKGETPAEDPEDMWCQGRNGDEYPSYLRQLPPNFDIPSSPTQSPGNFGVMVTPSLMASLVLAGIGSLLHL